MLLHDLRLAGRVLGRNRLSSALAILCFGIGLAAAATLIAVTNAVIVAALPYKDPSTLVSVRAERRETAQSALSSTEFLDYQREARTIDGLAAFMQWDNMVDRSGRHLVKGAGVSPTFFRVLGVDAILGRTFQPGDTGSSRLAVVSWNFWQRRFAGLPQAIGSRLDLDGRVCEVIGIMPRSFRHLNDDDIDVWTLWAPGGDRLNRRFSIVGRIGSGASLRTARAELNVIAARLEKEYPTSNAGWRIQIIPLMEATIGQIRPMIALLAMAVGFLLAVALIDVMHLLLAHSIVGGREFAIRLALGAARRQLVRQAVIQSMLVSSAGAALGILFSRALVPQIASLGGSYVPRIVNASVDHNVLIFTVALAALLGVVSGTATGLRIANVDVQPLLIEGSRQTGGRTTTKLYRALLTSQIALTLLLCVNGAVLIKSFNSLRQIDLGFTPNNVWLVQVRVPPELALSSSDYSPQLFRSILGSSLI